MAETAENQTDSNTQPDPQEQPANPASGATPNQNPETGKTFTESEFNAMMTARLAKQEKALKAQYAEEAKTAAERAKLDEVERLQAEKADADKRIADLEAAKTAAERRASLTGKVADPEAALKLLDESVHLTEDGSIDTDALLKSYPFLAVTDGQKRVDIPGARTSAAATGNLSPEDFRGKSPEWIQANLHRLTPGGQ